MAYSIIDRIAAMCHVVRSCVKRTTAKNGDKPMALFFTARPLPSFLPSIPEALNLDRRVNTYNYVVGELDINSLPCDQATHRRATSATTLLEYCSVPDLHPPPVPSPGVYRLVNPEAPARRSGKSALARGGGGPHAPPSDTARRGPETRHPRRGALPLCTFPRRRVVDEQEG